MNPSAFARVQIYIGPTDPNAFFVREVFGRFGLCAEIIADLPDPHRDHTDILILAGRGELPSDTRANIAEWVQSGGILFCIGQSWGFEQVLSILPFEHRPIGRGVLTPAEAQKQLWPEEASPATFFGGTFAAIKDAKPLAWVDDFVGCCRNEFGSGLAYFLAPDLGQTVCMMQMGSSVECDGLGPNDGSVVLSDGVNRAEDGVRLSFEHDRQTVPHGDNPFFANPHADVIKEFLFRLILASAQRMGKVLAYLWLWPNGSRGAAVCAVECQEFDSEKVFSLKQLLDVSHVPAVWLVSAPGFGAETYRMIRRWDDEIGLLFNPSSGGWTSEGMRTQYLSVHRVSGVADLVTAKPADGKWFGYRLFYELTDRCGSRVSLSKGGRQPGSQGFLFGTCQPYFTPKSDGKPAFTLELPPLIHRPGEICVTPKMHHIFRVTSLRNGAVTMTIPVSFDRVIALKQVFLLAMQYQLEWMLPAKMLQFERTRRGVDWKIRKETVLDIGSSHAHDQVVLCLVGPAGQVSVESRAVTHQTARHFGVETSLVPLKNLGKTTLRVRICDEESIGRAA